MNFFGRCFSYMLVSLLAGCLPTHVPEGEQGEQQMSLIPEKTKIVSSFSTPQRQS